MKDILLFLSFMNLSPTLYIYLFALTGHFGDCKNGYWNQNMN